MTTPDRRIRVGQRSGATMTLAVFSFWNDPETGERQSFMDSAEGRCMAGVEQARWDLWGSEAVRRRGATFLPRLAKGDLWVDNEELDAFETEVVALMTDLAGLHGELNYRIDSLAHYLDNFLRAIEHARSKGGGVCIE
jgi:hypothetical protein